MTTAPARPPYYPVGLDLADRPVLLVGGGAVAEGKVDALLEAGAHVTLVSPAATPRLVALAEAGRLAWVRRPFEPDDARAAWIAIAATDDRGVNARVAAAARAAGRLVNAVDDVPNCDFIAMALLRRGGVQVAISTGGGSPALARWLREELEALLPDQLGALLDILAELRAELKAAGRIPPFHAWRRAISPEVLGLLAEGRRADARAALADALGRAEPARPGVVYLVGAGPGDPDLITVGGRDRLARADAVVYDHLVDERILGLARPGACLIYAGKEPGARVVPQEETNALLVELARSGQVVVRLKGGDPFVFGRGGEEVLALAEAGVPFEVVPGVSSAFAVPADAAIPVTHRGIATSVTVVTGHESPDKPSSTLAWDEIARAGGTIVILMGMANLPAIVDRLIAAGRPPSTPAAVVQNGTRPDRRVVVGTLSDIFDRSRSAGLAAPAVIIIGDVVSLRSQLLETAPLPADATALSPLPGVATMSPLPGGGGRAGRLGEPGTRPRAGGGEGLFAPIPRLSDATRHSLLPAQARLRESTPVRAR